MSVINSMPKRKFEADSLRIIVGFQTHGLREESTFVFRRPPHQLYWLFRRRPSDGPRRSWKIEWSVCFGPPHFHLAQFNDYQLRNFKRETDLCEHFFCSEKIVLQAVMVLHIKAVVDREASPAAILGPVTRKKCLYNSFSFSFFFIKFMLTVSRKFYQQFVEVFIETVTRYFKGLSLLFDWHFRVNENGVLIIH